MSRVIIHPRYHIATGGATVLLLHGNGSDGSTTFTDSSPSAHVPDGSSNNVQIDTAQSKFGGASILYDGTNDRLEVPDHDDWDFGTGDFTIDLWMRMSSAHNFNILSHSGGLDVGRNGSGFLFFGSSTSSSAWSVSANTWTHIAITRSGTSLYFFKDGTQLGTTQTNSEDISLGSGALHIGTKHDETEDYNGWMDEIRVIKGSAAWTANFTPETSEYS